MPNTPSKSFPARLFAGLFALTALTASAQSIPSHRTFNPRNLRLVFAYGDLTVPAVQSKLDTLHAKGVNSLVYPVGRNWQANNLANTIPLIRSNPTLLKFKHVVSIQSLVYDGLDYCNPSKPYAAQAAQYCGPTKTLAQRCAETKADPNGVLRPMAYICDDLDAVAELVQANADLFAGYYTFDEPILDGYPAPAWYQVQIYNYLRSRDPDINARPVFIANTLGESQTTDAIIQDRMSVHAQDVHIIDQYGAADPDGSNYLANVTYQRNALARWKQFNLLTKPVVFALRGQGLKNTPDAGTSCGPVGPANGLAAIETALNQLYTDPTEVVRYGLAWWAFNDAEHWDIEDCQGIADEVALQVPASLDQVPNTLSRQVGNFGQPSHNAMIQTWNNRGRLAINVYPLGIPGQPANSHMWSHPDMGQGSMPLARLTGDVDGDGDTDLIHPLNNNGLLDMVVYKTDGVGYGSAPSRIDYSVDTSPVAVAWLTGDFDDSETTDVVRVSNIVGGMRISLYRSTSVGFTVNWTDFAHPSAGTFLVGDATGDGVSDIIHSFSSNGKQGLVIYRSNGNSFTRLTPYVDPWNGYVAAPLVVRFNADNTADIVAPWNDLGHQGLIVYTSNGTAYSGAWSDTDEGNGYFDNLLTGDINEDGLTDLIGPWNNQGHQGFVVFTSNGSSYTNTWSRTDHLLGYTPAHFVADINSDGRSDVIGAWTENGAQRFFGYTSNGTGLYFTWGG